MKLYSPTVDRNREAIAAALEKVLRAPSTVLEVGSGSGQHAAYFASRFSTISWLPSERDDAELDSIAAWRMEAGLPNLRQPILLDVTHEVWTLPVEVDAVLAIDLVGPSTWPATVSLLRGAARVLPAGGPLVIYARELPRPLEEIEKVARAAGLTPQESPGPSVHVFRRS